MTGTAATLPTVALTIKQPWASLIIAGVKDVENRVWSTPHRRLLAIHAAKRDDETWAKSRQSGQIAEFYDRRGWATRFPTGVILGWVTLVDVIRDSRSVWADPGCWHWLLADPVILERPVPCRGQQQLWKCADKLAATPQPAPGTSGGLW